MRNRLSRLASAFANALDTKLIGLLHIGSKERQDDSAFSDLDLIMLTETLSIEDFSLVRAINRNLDYFVDMPIIQRNQIPADPDLFQNGTHGCYFLYVLKSADTICGINLFSQYPEPSVHAVRLSVYRKLAEYIWVSRRTFVESNRERTLFQNYQLNSRLLKSVKDLLLLSGVDRAYSFTATKAVDKLLAKTRRLLYVEESTILRSIADPRLRNALAVNMSEDFLRTRVSILEKLYARALSLGEGLVC